MKTFVNHISKKMLLSGSLATVCLLLFSACNDDPGNMHFDYENGAIQLSESTVTLNSGGTLQIVEVTSKLTESGFEIEKAEAGAEWLTATLEGNIISITGEPNLTGEVRSTLVTVKAGTWTTELTVEQEKVGSAKDILVPITDGRATSENNTASEPRGIDKAYDGDYSSYHNSLFGVFSAWPFEYEFDLETPNKLDYFIYHARGSAGTNVWGMWGEFDCYVKYKGVSDFVKIGEYDHGKNYGAATYEFDEPLVDVETVKFLINNAENDRVSCAEMEFYTYSDAKFDWTTIFTDASCSELKSGVTREDIENITDGFYKTLACQLFDGTYPSDYRVQTYRPYQNPTVMKNHNRNSYPYSLKDNPTGIWAEEGEEIMVLVGDTKGQSLSILIEEMRYPVNVDRDRFEIYSTNYLLSEGVNYITPDHRGLMYVQNFTDQAVPLKLETSADKALAESMSVRIHIVDGTVQGYWSSERGDSQQDFLKMLSEATYTEFDAYGEFSHLLWNVESWMTYQTDIVTLMERLDWVVKTEWEFMGLYKYDHLFANRAHVQCGYGYGAAYATHNRTNYNMNFYENLFTGQVFETRMWVLGHEIGHANQFDGIKWTGIGEVSNNIYCLDLQRKFGYTPAQMELGSKGYYAGAKTNIRDAGQPHYMEGKDGDVFYWKLVPFWQLELYIAEALGYTDFYKDLYEDYRRNYISGTSAPQQQVDFAKNVCDIAKLDLTDFFVKWGFLIPCTDSGLTVSQKMVDDAIAYIAGKNYHKPTMDVSDIEDSTWEDYMGAVEAGWSIPVYN